jgi:predicted AlkP superfamily pyrophosphatase or phosphodiesterase
LAVLVVFDQMRGDYLTRWDNLFGDGGFHRLEKEGSWFQNCHYPYANTVTGAGHASLVSGCSPSRHGIVGNDWYERLPPADVYCATATRYQTVPSMKPRNEEHGLNKPEAAGAPIHLRSPTLGDALKKATGDRSRVVAVSFKDRSAVLPGGSKADVCYWLDTSTGRFITSTYYRDAPHKWVKEFNDAGRADQWFDKEWTRIRPDLEYEPYSSKDDQPGEGKGISQGRIFPHSMKGGKTKPGRDSREAMYNSPFGNELLLEFVKRAIDAEQLGTRATPDLLTVSFSCNDPIGHCWGPDSQEVLDVTLRSDLIVKELLAYLDAKVGKGRYTLVLSADHGVCPLPEVVRARGEKADRIAPEALEKSAAAFLDKTYGDGDGKPRWIEKFVPPWFYLNRGLLNERSLKANDVEDALAGWLKKQPGIQTAYTSSQLDKGPLKDDPVGEAVRKSNYPGRSGDVTVVVKPHYQFLSYLTGTGHGTPHPYDTHVPLLVYGPGIRPGARKDRVTPQATAAILARALGIEPPAHAEAPLPAGLFRE